MSPSYGGVVFNAKGEVLLRRPTDDWDETVWTFPKGGVQTGQSPEETAIREVLEETGYKCRIFRSVPGSYRGSTTINQYFVMMPEGDPQPFDEKETQAILWVTPEEAPSYIKLTRKIVARERDLEVLRMAVFVWREMTLPM